MKKIKLLLSILCVIGCLFALTACGEQANSTNNTTTAATVAATTIPAGTTAAPAQSGTDKKSVIYKDIMVPFDQIIPTEHIVILQNALNYSRDGFYTEDNCPVTTKITYKDKEADAYALTYAINLLTYGLEGDVTVYDPEGKTTVLKAEDLAGAYVMLDFMSEDAPVIYNPETKTEIAAFAYLTTAKGEAIYSVVSGSTHNTKDVITACGWKDEGEFRYMASDKFHIPVPSAENAVGELRGALSGAINGSFPTLTIASGKINDVIYIEKIH